MISEQLTITCQHPQTFVEKRSRSVFHFLSFLVSFIGIILCLRLILCNGSHSSSVSSDENRISARMIYSTHTNETISIDKTVVKLLIEEYFKINDEVLLHDFQMILMDDVHKTKRSLQKDHLPIDICDLENDFNANGSFVQLTIQKRTLPTDFMTRSLIIPVKLSNGQIFHVRMNHCSEMTQNASVTLIGRINDEEKDKNLMKYQVMTCPGGLYPHDHKCVSYQYGTDPIQAIDCHIPVNPSHSILVLLVHGGYWHSIYNRSIEDAVANDLVRLNLIVCNLDYRSVGNGGGFPNTFYDVANGTDLLPTIAHEQGFNAERIIIVGHSAGGQLGGFLAGRFRLEPDQAGFSENPVRPIAFVSQAGVNNMWDGCDQWRKTGDGAVIKFLGGDYKEYPQRYRQSSLAASTNPTIRYLYPSEFLPLNIPIQAITGSADITVPITQTIDFVQQAKMAGDNCTEVIVPGEDHFVHLNPTSQSWNLTRSFILSFIG